MSNFIQECLNIYGQFPSPQQRLLFEAPPFAELEIYTGELASAILQERIPGDRLRVALGN
jgi:hypothetical protein